MSKWIPPPDFWKRRGLPEPESEFRFCKRRWRFDFAWTRPYLIALEVEGGIWMPKGFGGHNRGSGMVRDMEKQNEATRMGWKIFRFSTDQMEEESTAEFLRSVLQ